VKRARARAMRIRQPPLKSRVLFACISLVKPSPCRSDAARASILSDSSRSNLRREATGGRQQAPESTVVLWCVHIPQSLW